MVDNQDLVADVGNDNPNKITNPDLAHVFKNKRDDFPAKPYHEDGNPEMYTKDNMAKRATLKDSPIVREAIKKFMSEFQMSGNQANRHITKEEYCRVFSNVGMILRPSIEADELTKIIKEDFENDSADKVDPNAEKNEKKEGEQEAQQPKTYDILSEDKLYDALFELVDTWTQNADELEYKGFFSQLEFRMKYAGQGSAEMAYDPVMM